MDSDRLICLDVFTGRLLWEREGLEVMHLLGVRGNQLLFTTGRGLHAVATATGLDHGGWVHPAEGQLPTLGRGQLFADHFLWPTAASQLPCRLIDLRDGSMADFDPSRLHQIKPGNMAFASGWLVVAGPTELAAYK